MAVIGLPKDQGLAPTYVDPDTGRWGNSLLSLGSRGDSYYEYLLKSYLHEGKRDKRLLAAFQESMAGVANRLFTRSSRERLLFVAEARAVPPPLRPAARPAPTRADPPGFLGAHHARISLAKHARARLP